MVSLRTKIGSIELTSPGMVASGIMDETGLSMVRMLEYGASAVVTKSIGLKPNAGHPNPCLVEVEGGYINAMGLPNPGIDLFAGEMKSAVMRGNIIGSIYGTNQQDFSDLAIKMEEYGACAVELNLSCPNVKGYGMELGTDPYIVKKIVSSVKSSVSIPVWVKLTPNTHLLTEVGIAVQDAGGDAIVAINTIKAMVISPEFGKPILGNIFGGLSYTAIKPVGVRAIFDLRSAVDIPLVGVGGISSWRDAVEYMMAGASAFQVGSAISMDGIDIFRRINDGLSSFMDEYDYNSIKSLVGVAHE